MISEVPRCLSVQTTGTSSPNFIYFDSLQLFCTTRCTTKIEMFLRFSLWLVVQKISQRATDRSSGTSALRPLHPTSLAYGLMTFHHSEFTQTIGEVGLPTFPGEKRARRQRAVLKTHQSSTKTNGLDRLPSRHSKNMSSAQRYQFVWDERERWERAPPQ